MGHTAHDLDATRMLTALRALRQPPSPPPNTVDELTHLVVEADAEILQKEVRSLAELGLRAQVLGLLVAINELSIVMRQLGHRSRGFDDAFNFLLDSLWSVHRQLKTAQTSPESSVYDDEIRAAQDLMASIASATTLQQFLSTGASFANERVRHACSKLQELLSFHFPVEQRDRVSERSRRPLSPMLHP